MNLNCIIVDDEPSGRQVLEEYILETPFLKLKGKAENPLVAYELLQAQPIDLIFLDIQMPKINGLDFLRSLEAPPMVILTTAFSEYALKGFEYNVIDYLLKPIALQRFIKASTKAKDYFELSNNQSQSSDYFFVKCNSKFEKIFYDDLLFVEAANNYVLFQTIDKRHISYLTFKSIEESLPQNQFIKVHKSFIISISKIKNLDSEEITVGTHTIPISRKLKDVVMNSIIEKKLVKR